jgi:hypothetical protein
MTRVILSVDVLEYRQAMAALVDEVCQKNRMIGVDPECRRNELLPLRKELSAFWLDGLLRPPRIEALNPYLFPPEDQVDGIIQITASGDYGVINVYVTLEDDRGKQIESGFALKDKVEKDDWFYFPCASPPSGTSVTVRAIAMDPLGGIGTQNENITV